MKLLKNWRPSPLNIWSCKMVANGLFNVTALGVVALSPEPEACDRYTGWHRFWWESWFLWTEKNWRPRRRTLRVRLRLSNVSPCTSPGSNPGHSGGRRRWWPLHQRDSPVLFINSHWVIVHIGILSNIPVKHKLPVSKPADSPSFLVSTQVSLLNK